MDLRKIVSFHKGVEDFKRKSPSLSDISVFISEKFDERQNLLLQIITFIPCDHYSELLQSYYLYRRYT